MHLPQCAPAIARERHMKGAEGKLSLMSLSGSGLHSGLESVLTPPWLRDSGAQALRNQADQLSSQPRWRKWLLVMSTVIIKGHNEMRVSIKERTLWVKRKKEYESRLWRVTLKNQIWLTGKLSMNHHTTHSPGLSVWRSELCDLPCSRVSQMTSVCSALSTVLLFGQRHGFPGDFTEQWGTWLIPVQSTELH